MYLDTTILQSLTAISLVEFIKEQQTIIKMGSQVTTAKIPEHIIKDYNRIIALHDKALRRRSRKL